MQCAHMRRLSTTLGVIPQALFTFVSLRQSHLLAWKQPTRRGCLACHLQGSFLRPFGAEITHRQHSWLFCEYRHVCRDQDSSGCWFWPSTLCERGLSFVVHHCTCQASWPVIQKSSSLLSILPQEHWDYRYIRFTDMTLCLTLCELGGFELMYLMLAQPLYPISHLSSFCCFFLF